MSAPEALPERDQKAVTDEQFGDLFALGQILSIAIKQEGYRPSDHLLTTLSPGKYGQAILGELKTRHPSLTDDEARIALVDEMAWDDLFFTANETNILTLESELSRELAACAIRIPWVYSGHLYRKATNLFDRIKDRLSPEETLSLLSDTPQGVCQMRTFVSGPLGLLRSKQKRDRPPQRRVPLWHCSDPSCAAIHGAVLTGSENSSDAQRVLRTVLTKGMDGWKALRRRYGHLSDSGEYYDDLNPGGLIPFLGDAFCKDELRAIVSDLLSGARGLRAYLTRLQRGARFSGSAAQIASRLDEAACLQIILLETDESIVGAIDKLIAEGTINIPISETRSARHGVNTRRGWYDVKCEASCHGVRFVSADEGVSLARLKRLIREVHGAEGNSSDLGWRLRYTPGDSTSQKLDGYANDHSPEEALREHILVSPATLARAFEIIKYGHFTLPKAADEEEKLVKRLIWKLGFDVLVHPLQYRALADSIEKLQDANRTYRNRSGDNVSRIRSEAVNVFVELERFLGDSLAFMTWVLTSDHYTGTGFSFEVGGYYERMAELFDGYQSEIGVQRPVIFDPLGKNTLFPLISGFKLLADYCRKLFCSTDLHTRRSTERPGYAGHARLQVFPFQHTKFVLDLRENIRTNVISELVGITTALETARVAGIRNRIEHNREDFPTKEEILSVLDAVVLLTERMQKLGFAPLSYAALGKRTDEWGRVSYDFENYRGETVTIPYRAELAGSRLPIAGGFLIVIPSIKIGDTEEIARFLIAEPSEYRDMWKDYPIRKPGLHDDPD